MDAIRVNENTRVNQASSRTQLVRSDSNLIDFFIGDKMKRIPYSQNRRPIRDGTSKYKGISWHKLSNKWQAYIRINRKKIHLGVFDNEITAAKAYDKQAKRLFGEFAYLNFED